MPRTTVGTRGVTSYETPSNIAGLKVWLRADALNLSNGASVTSWTDTVQNIPFTQSTPANQPVFNSSALNGFPTVTFNGSSTTLNSPSYTAATTPIPKTGTMTVIAVVKASTGTANRRFCGWTAGGGWGAGQTGSVQMDFTTFGVKAYATGTDDFNPLANFYVATYSFDDSFDVTFYLNGTSKGTVAHSADASGSGTTSFGIGQGNSQYWNSDIAEILIFDCVLSSSYRNKVHAYLGNKYGLTIAGGETVSRAAA